MAIENILSQNFFGNSVEQYLIAIGIFIAVSVTIYIFKRYFLYIFKKAAEKTSTRYDDIIIEVIESIKWPFFIILAFYVSVKMIQVPNEIIDSSYYLLMVGVLFYGVRALQAIIDELAKDYQQKSQRKSRLGGESKAVKYISQVSKLVLWLIAALLLATNLGFEITPLIAGLGIGGIAIAFALQTILSDVFNFFAIYLDKPFMEGDFLIIGDDLGAVEKIGLRSTRIKTLRGEELIISNNELTSTRIHNFRKMENRRISFSFGITYETPTQKMEKIPGIIKKIVQSCEKTRFDRTHFKDFGDFSLNYEVVYYLDSTDYNFFMDTQQKINLATKKAFEKEGINFAYPTQLVYTKKP